MKACIFKRSPSGIDHHGGRNVAIRVPVPICVGGGGSLTVDMNQRGGDATSPIYTFSFCDSGRELYCVTAILAAASARSLPRIFVQARIL